MSFSLPDDLEQVAFLSVADVTFIHEQLILPGQLAGVRDMGALEAAVGRVQSAASFDYGADLARLAAYYWHGISANHPFHDGNKRAGYFSMLAFLETNGFEFMGSDDEMGGLIYELFETDQFTVNMLEPLVRDNSRPLLA